VLELDERGPVREERPVASDRLPVAAPAGAVDLDREREVARQVARAELEEGGAEEILVGFVERLGRNLSDILPPVARKQRRPVAVLQKANEDLAVGGCRQQMREFVVVFGEYFFNRQIRKNQSEIIPEGQPAEVIEAEREERFLEELPHVELAAEHAQEHSGTLD